MGSSITPVVGGNFNSVNCWVRTWTICKWTKIILQKIYFSNCRAAGVAVPLALKVSAGAPLEERLHAATQLLDTVPLIDGHNDLPWNIRKFLHNQLNEFRYRYEINLWIYLVLLYLSGRFKSKETNFRMSHSIINNLTFTDQTKLLFYLKYLSRLWLYGVIIFIRKMYMFMHVSVSFDLKRPDILSIWYARN